MESARNAISRQFAIKNYFKQMKTSTQRQCLSDYNLQNQGYGSAMLVQARHRFRLALDSDNGYVFRHY